MSATDRALDRLHPGEREAILLAEQAAADIIILDERVARRIAAARGRTVTGTLGVLAEASDRDLIDLRVAVQRLQKTTFRAAPALLRSLLHRKRP